MVYFRNGHSLLEIASFAALKPLTAPQTLQIPARQPWNMSRYGPVAYSVGSIQKFFYHWNMFKQDLVDIRIRIRRSGRISDLIRVIQ